MSERALRRYWRSYLRSLQIQPPLDVHDLCRTLSERRGRPIHLTAYRLPVPGPFGIWVAAADRDHILYQQETTRTHQDHIIVHELGHLMAGHDSDGDDPFLRAVMPDLPPDTVRHALRRTSYDQRQEREAEVVATLILEWASVVNRVAPPAAPDQALGRVQSALGDHLGWL